MKTWIKFGWIFALIYAIIEFFAIIFNDSKDLLFMVSNIPMSFLLHFFDLNISSFVAKIFISIALILSSLIFWFLIGVIIGWIVQKIKSSNNKK